VKVVTINIDNDTSYKNNKQIMILQAVV